MIDVDNLPPAPDISGIDFSKMDFGNDPDSAVVTDEAPLPDDKKEDIFEEDADTGTDTGAEEKPADEKPAEEKPVEEKPRDEQGKFVKKDKAEARVPKSRFDEAVAKEREAKEAAEKRAEELERRLTANQQQAAQQVQRSDAINAMEAKVDELTAKHSKLMLDGDSEAAAAVMKEIRQSERQIARLEAQEEAQQIVSQTIEEDRLNLAIAQLESTHPVLNPKSDQFDPDIVQTVLLWQGSYIEKGMSPSMALKEASTKVLTNFYRAPEEKSEDKRGLASTMKTDRQKAAVEKAVTAAKAQPASLQTHGLDSDKMGEKGLPDVTKMSVEEFNALPETMKAKLRGDLA